MYAVDVNFTCNRWHLNCVHQFAFKFLVVKCGKPLMDKFTQYGLFVFMNDLFSYSSNEPDHKKFSPCLVIFSCLFWSLYLTGLADVALLTSF